MFRFQASVSLPAFLLAGFIALPASADDAAPLCGWTSRAPMTDGGVVRAMTVDDSIYVLGGGTPDEPSNGLRVYDPSADLWEDLTPMSEHLFDFGLAELDGKLYRIGGNLNTSNFVASAEAYDIATDAWSTIADLPEPMGHTAAAALNGKLYAIGGAGNGFHSLDAVHAYDPGLDAWAPVAPLLEARAGHAVVVVNGKIYALGGVEGGDSLLSSVEAYDPDLDSWSLITTMPGGAHALFGAASFHGHIVLAGGVAGLDRLHQTAHRYDPVSDVWNPLPSLPVPVSSLAAAVFDNKLFTFGGVGGVLDGPAFDAVHAFPLLAKEGLLSRSTEEPSGEHCPVGGTRIEVGLDTSCDGELDDEDEPAVIYVCRGAEGEAPAEVLIENREEASGDNCARGGYRIDVGTDLDGDGKLSPSEVRETTYVCHGDYGQKGANGDDGRDGRDGFSGTDGSSGCSTSPGYARGSAAFVASLGALLMLGWRRRRATKLVS